MLAATDPDRDLGACLPPLVDATAHFAIAPAIADELGLPATVRVSAGGGDNMMAAIGTGNVSPGVLSLSLGTSGTLFTTSDHPLVDDAMGWAAFCSSTGGWLPLVCTMNCTVATESVAAACGFETRDGDALLAGTRPGAAGLGMLPFFHGERTPDLPRARGNLYGLHNDNFTRGNADRAAMEGATFALRNGFDALRATGLGFDAIRLTGGGSNSGAWRQMIADVFNLPVQVPAQSEGAAFGAALQALWAHSTDGSAAALSAIAREHVQMIEQRGANPDAGAVPAYGAAYQEFLRQLHAAKSLYS
jgi:xylulokinase